MVVEGFDPITEPGLQIEWHKKGRGNAVAYLVLFPNYTFCIFNCRAAMRSLLNFAKINKDMYR